MIDFKIWKLTLQNTITIKNTRIYISPQRYKRWVKEYFFSEKSGNEFNFQLLIHIFPIVLAVSQILWSKYHTFLVVYGMEKNLPGLSILYQTVSLETFQQVTSKKLGKKNIKDVQIFQNSVLINSNSPSENLFIGSFSNNDIKTTKFPKQLQNWFYIPLKTRSESQKTSKQPKIIDSIVQGNLYYLLDEIPLKIESFEFINKKRQQIESEKKLPYLYLEKNNNLNKKLNLKFNYIKSKPISLENNLFFVRTNFQKIKPYNFITNTIKTNNKKLTKDDILSKQIRTLFYKNNLKTNPKFTPNIIDHNILSSISQFHSFSSQDLLETLDDWFPIQKNLDIKPLYLSGYLYPDMNKKDIFSLQLKYAARKTPNPNWIKIDLPKTLPPFFIDEKYIPSFFVNEKLLNSQKDGFFETDFEKNDKKTFDLQKALINENYRENILKLKESGQEIDTVDDSDPDSWFLILKQIENEKLPYLEFELLQKKIQNALKYKRENNFLVNQTSLDILGIDGINSKKIKFHFIPSFQSFSETTTKKIQFGKQYKRIPTFESMLGKVGENSQPNTFHFFEIHEPITQNSWMIISQISILIFLIHILKDLYKEYGRELISYVLQFASSLGVDVTETKEQFLADDTDKGYRFIKKVKKQFKDIAGIDGLLSQLAEIVFYLRNGGKSSQLQTSLPKGLLLVGPPGTGKTLLVQAIAGEAEVPVLAESGILLADPQEKRSGVERLRNIFAEARKLSPCIIFIDEIDTLGEKRQQIIQPSMGEDEILETVYPPSNSNIFSNEEEFIPTPEIEDDSLKSKDTYEELFGDKTKQRRIQKMQEIQQRMRSQKTRLGLLMQFLIEMDGVHQLEGVVIIGATNRPTVLDPALLRPGRFDRIVHIELPGKQKRIEILKLYSQKLNTETSVSWDYLANRTAGFSAADIAAAMNESAIQAIIQETFHTVETIEKGLDLVSSYGFEKPTLNWRKTDPFFILRFVYYQAGNAVLHSILPEHQRPVIFYLWPRPKNARHNRIQNNPAYELQTRFQLENTLIGHFAGKASELLLLHGSQDFPNYKYWESSIGMKDLLSASYLAQLMINKWYFYSKQLVTRKFHLLVTDRNEKMYQEEIEKLEFLNLMEDELEDEIEFEKLYKIVRPGHLQQQGFGAWWQIQVSEQSGFIGSANADWFRIYLPDPEESIMNIDWVDPDEYYHTNNKLKTLSPKSQISLNDLYEIEKDYIYHGLILNGFNSAFSILENHREFLDYFADYLIRYEVLRQDQISYIFRNIEKNKKLFETSTMFSQDELTTGKQKIIKILDKGWGTSSRRKSSRFINFDLLQPITKSSSNKSFFDFPNLQNKP